MKKELKIGVWAFALLILNACATFEAQYANLNTKQGDTQDKEIAHSFYLIGDAGNSPIGQVTPALKAFEKALNDANTHSTAIFLGDNIYDKGMPKKEAATREFAEYQLDVQTNAVKNFKGETIFIPGNHDWYSGGPGGVKRQERYIEDILGKNSFLPENGCPIDRIHITDDIDLILVDSHWYVTDWDKYPTINDECMFNTRALFLDEFESFVKKARGKTTIVAMHHPMYSHGPHGGHFTAKEHLKPLPVIGTVKNVLRETSGVLNVDLQNKKYNDLKRKLVTLAQENDKVIFVSGHEHSLQYIVEDNLRQIISGSGSKTTGTRNVGGGVFAYATPGYARLDVYEDGSSNVQFYSAEEDKVVFESQVIAADVPFDKTYPEDFPKVVEASVYTKEETEISGFGKMLWGERFREEFGTKIKAPTVKIDTLFGGLKPIRKGGGTQSKSLRLEAKDGRQYVMRALRKQATQYLQSALFVEQYYGEQLDDTALEELTLDVFTGSHPYAPFVVGTLADAVGIFHTNPVLYYVPHQNALGRFNLDFGDELCMIEEHTSEGHSDQASFGFQDKLIATDEMMKKLHKDEDIVIDEASYIKARLFDMLIGDWDRHQDQWRWIEFEEDGKKVYRPMPRDRDQPFSKMSDGFMMGATVTLAPTTRLLRKYSDDLVDVKGVNMEPFPLDMELIQQSGKDVWDAQVKILQNGITDEVIETAFLNMPPEVRNASVDEIKRTLKARRANLQKIADRYFKLINKFAVIKGTDKDDWFDVERLTNGRTKVTAYRIKDGEKADIFHERIYAKYYTKEIWIYALDDDDVFNVFGDGDCDIKVRLIGGQNNDVYDIKNGSRVTYYDYKSKPNTVVTKKGIKKFSDDYETNVYDYKKNKNNTNQLIPTLGFNPDDGVKIGVANTITNYGFERNPFTSQHSIAAAYYFATNGYDLDYSGEFANVFKRVNLAIDANFNSPNFAVNYFGIGNETPNFEADDDDGVDVDLDFNRVKIRSFHVQPSLVWRGDLGASFKFGLLYESNEVERTPDRFISTIPEDDAVFDNQSFYGAEVTYNYENSDDKALPKLGFLFNVIAGYKNNTQTSKGFGYIIPELGITNKLDHQGKLVLDSKIRTHFNIGDDFEFYQGATIGANTGLRGLRNERFTGKTSFVQTTNLRWDFGRFKTSIIPMRFGVFGGFDYGRVWIKNDTSDKWHNAYGGGFFVNFVDLITGTVGVFDSEDGPRVWFKLAFGL